jgi:hypothetical protein
MTIDNPNNIMHQQLKGVDLMSTTKTKLPTLQEVLEYLLWQEPHLTPYKREQKAKEVIEAIKANPDEATKLPAVVDVVEHFQQTPEDREFWSKVEKQHKRGVS